MEPFLIGLGVMVAVGVMMGGIGILIIAHNWPPKFTMTLDDVRRDRDDGESWKYQ